MRAAKILVVEDEVDIRELIHFHLFKNKYDVLEASNGPQAFELCKSEQPSLVILDIMIPGFDGLKLCKKLKEDKKTKDIKVIFLSAKGTEDEIVKGLELGADDYVTKPFSPKVLMARVRTVLARGMQSFTEEINGHGICIDESRKKVTIDDPNNLQKKSEVSVTQSEFQLLKLFMSSPGRVFTRAQLVSSLKGENHAVTDRAIDTHLVSLRKKMGEKGQLIETVWGVGYRFKEYEN